MQCSQCSAQATHFEREDQHYGRPDENLDPCCDEHSTGDYYYFCLMCLKHIDGCESRSQDRCICAAHPTYAP